MDTGNLNLGPASLADTGQWQLTVEISSTGISAFLNNTEYEGVPTVRLFRQTWDEDPSRLLENIETTVFDNPRMLEDFATRLIITTPKSLWIPEDHTEDEEFDESYFTAVYPAASDDIMADFDSGEVCLYTLTPGLNSFLRRTLPGSRINSHMSVLKTLLRGLEEARRGSHSYASPLRSVYVNVREGEADIFAFSDTEFLCGATHLWKEPEDLLYRTLLVETAYGFRPHDTCLTLICPVGDMDRLKGSFSEFFPALSWISTGNDGQGESFAASIATGFDFKIEVINEDNKREIRKEEV